MAYGTVDDVRKRQIITKKPFPQAEQDAAKAAAVIDAEPWNIAEYGTKILF